MSDHQTTEDFKTINEVFENVSDDVVLEEILNIESIKIESSLKNMEDEKIGSRKLERFDKILTDDFNLKGMKHRQLKRILSSEYYGFKEEEMMMEIIIHFVKRLKERNKI